MEDTIIYPYQMCDGVIDCQPFGLDEDESNCKANRFICKASDNSVSIDMDKKCDGIIDCMDGTDEDSTLCNHRFQCSSMNGTKVSDRTDKLHELISILFRNDSLYDLSILSEIHI